MFGIYIYQSNEKTARKKILKSMKILKGIRYLEDQIDQEQKRQEQLKAQIENIMS